MLGNLFRFLNLITLVFVLFGCGAGIEVGNPNLAKLQGLLTIQPEDPNVRYDAVFLKDRRVVIQRNAETTLSEYDRNAAEVSFVGNFDSGITMNVDFTYSNSQVTALSLEVDGSAQNQQKQSHLGAASAEVSGSYARLQNGCTAATTPLSIQQTGNTLELRGGLRDSNDAYPGSRDGENFLSWQLPSLDCEASVVGDYLAGACQRDSGEFCLFVFKK